MFCCIYRFNIHYIRLHILKKWSKNNFSVLIITYCDVLQVRNLLKHTTPLLRIAVFTTSKFWRWHTARLSKIWPWVKLFEMLKTSHTCNCTLLVHLCQWRSNAKYQCVRYVTCNAKKYKRKKGVKPSCCYSCMFSREDHHIV